jgi:hypothetical protein
MKPLAIIAAATFTLVAAEGFAQSEPQAGEPPHQALSEAAAALRASIAAMEGQETGRSEVALRHARAALVRTQNAIVTMDAEVKEVDEAAKQAREAQAKAAGTAKPTDSAKLAAGPAKAPEAQPASAPVDGCWVRLHDQPGFAGSALTLAGGLDVKEVTRQVVPGWKGAGSVVVGPTARLIAKKDGATLAIAPGQELEDVRNTVPPGLFASLDTMQVSCEG